MLKYLQSSRWLISKSRIKQSCFDVEVTVRFLEKSDPVTLADSRLMGSDFITSDGEINRLWGMKDG